MASLLCFLSPNARISASLRNLLLREAEGSEGLQNLLSLLVFRILTETNMNSKSTKNGIGPNQMYSENASFAERNVTDKTKKSSEFSPEKNVCERRNTSHISEILKENSGSKPYVSDVVSKKPH